MLLNTSLDHKVCGHQDVLRIPMSAIYGMIINLSCENVNGSFIIKCVVFRCCCNYCWHYSKGTIEDSTVLMSMVRVDPTVGTQLIKTAQNSDHCCKSSYFWGCYKHEGSSLKAICFTFPLIPTNIRIATFDQVAYIICLKWRVLIMQLDYPNCMVLEHHNS